MDKYILIKQKKWGIIGMVLFLSFSMAQIVVAQSVPVEFQPRKSPNAPAPYTNEQHYDLRGDFQMIGNSNLTAANDPNGTSTTQSNNTVMQFINVDPGSGIVNSSMAELAFPDIEAPECTKIIYAGLYWSGRSDDGGTQVDEWTATTSTKSATNINVNDGSQTDAYVLSITSTNDNSHGGNNGRLATYTFTPIGNAGDPIIFRFYSWRTTNNNNSYTQEVTVQVGAQSPQTISVTRTNNSSNNYAVSLNTPYNLPLGTGQVTSLRKRRTDNSVNSNFSATVHTPAVPGTSATVNKRKVKFRHEDDSYNDIVTNTEIRFPGAAEGYMYAGYSDVTEYVNTHGLGNYYVANMALREANGGSTGYYGSWGLVVIYENSELKRRSITVFDGYAYMVGSETASNTFPVSGFTATQHGDVRTTIGVMAGEGDLSISGDSFAIEVKDTGDYLYIDHNGNTSEGNNDGDPTGDFNNFFNSSISIAGNPARNPNNPNNYGSDIHMFDLVNTNNSIIENEQTKTSFKYGSTQDTYIIYSIVFAVDSYVPEPTLTVTGIDNPGEPNTAVENGDTVYPGDVYTMNFDIRNPGNEAIDNAVVKIPVPFNQHFVSVQDNFWHGIMGTQTTYPVWVSPDPNNNDSNEVAGGYIEWDLGQLPLMSPGEKSTILASFSATFRITDDCRLLTTSTCIDKTDLESEISGIGHISQTTVRAVGITGFTEVGDCPSPVFDPFKLNLIIDAEELNCPGIEQDPQNPDGNINVYFTADDIVLRNDIADDFPVGTVFYSRDPEDPTFSETNDRVNGDFDSPVNDAEPVRYYAVVPGMPNKCSMIIEIRRTACYEDPTIGEGILTKVGITLLKRSEFNGVWPMNREGGFVALESNSKGFVINRLDNNQMNAISNPVEGMIIYNTEVQCLMLFDGIAWKCFDKQSCE